VPREREDNLLARAAALGLDLYLASPLYDPAATAIQPGIVGLAMGHAGLGEWETVQGVQRLGGGPRSVPNMSTQPASILPGTPARKDCIGSSPLSIENGAQDRFWHGADLSLTSALLE
jgi:hypothetical protein